MLTNYEINCLNNKIDKKIKYTEEIINSIEIYKRELIKKIDRLTNHLQSEIKLLKKIYLNFNQYFSKYIYYKNIKNFINKF